MKNSSVDWPSWITAVSTFFAVIAATYASVKVYKLEKDRDKESSRIEKYFQANQISGWLTFNPNLGVIQSPVSEISVVAVVRNPSTQPVSEIRVSIFRQNTLVFENRARTIVPFDGFHTFILPKQLLLDLEIEKFPLVRSIFQDRLTYSELPDNFYTDISSISVQGRYPFKIAASISIGLSREFSLAFSFIDVNGISWERDQSGLLSLA